MSSSSPAAGDNEWRRVANPRLKTAPSAGGAGAASAAAAPASQGINPLTSAGAAANSDWRPPVTRTKLRSKFSLGRKKKSRDQHASSSGLALRQDGLDMLHTADFTSDARPSEAEPDAPRESRLGSALHNVADHIRAAGSALAHGRSTDAGDGDDDGGGETRPSSGILGMVLNPLAGKTKKNSV